jgi:hypothetical protein
VVVLLKIIIFAAEMRKTQFIHKNHLQ